MDKAHVITKKGYCTFSSKSDRSQNRTESCKPASIRLPLVFHLISKATLRWANSVSVCWIDRQIFEACVHPILRTNAPRIRQCYSRTGFHNATFSPSPHAKGVDNPTSKAACHWDQRTLYVESAPSNLWITFELLNTPCNQEFNHVVSDWVWFVQGIHLKTGKHGGRPRGLGLLGGAFLWSGTCWQCRWWTAQDLDRIPWRFGGQLFLLWMRSFNL